MLTQTLVYLTEYLYVEVPFVTDSDHSSKPRKSRGFDAQYEDYIGLRPKSIFVAAHTPARAKYGAQSNKPLVA